MGAPDTHAAVLDFLARLSRPPTAAANPTAMVDMSSVRIAIERHADRRCVLGGVCADNAGNRRYFFCFAVKESDETWRVQSGQFGMMEFPDHRLAFLFEVGTAAETTDCVGFLTGDGAAEVATVRLALSDGRSFDEPVSHGWVALTAPGEMRGPIAIDLIDAAGNLMPRHASGQPHHYDLPRGRAIS